MPDRERYVQEDRVRLEMWMLGSDHQSPSKQSSGPKEAIEAFERERLIPGNSPMNKVGSCEELLFKSEELLEQSAEQERRRACRDYPRGSEAKCITYLGRETGWSLLGNAAGKKPGALAGFSDPCAGSRV